MKLIVQIPCYNEQEHIVETIAQIPRHVPGIDQVEVLIIDDGSLDETVAKAREAGADHVVRLPKNQGLARAFTAGLDACVRLGADIIVNTDADNQYRAADIPRLVAPILAGEAEIVVGARPIASIAHFSWIKKQLQKLGSQVVRLASNTRIPDAPSGFRAIARDAAMRLNVFNDYTYTLETIIQAGQKNMAITSVDIGVNGPTRQSKLVRSIPSYVSRSLMTIMRISMTYSPLRFFGVPGLLFFIGGLLLGLRFVYFYFTGDGDGHVQSVVLAALMMGIGAFFMVAGLMADLIAVNRKLLEKLDWRVQKMEEVMRERPGE